jgi:hypothetical protein
MGQGWSKRFRQNLGKLVSGEDNLSERGARKQSLDLNSIRNSLKNDNGIMEMMTGGLSQPVWGPEINTVGGYSREGYTSKPFDTPAIPFRTQAIALQQDEDVQLAINRLTSQVTGGEHYLKTANDEVTDYLEHFAEDINFDTFDSQLVRELLWYGNSVWKPRMGIRNVRKFEDLMHIPISSYVRIWWDRQRQPYKYEFRGAQYQGYHNPEEIIVFDWNNVDASLFGTGFGVSLTSPRDFEMILNGDETTTSRLPSALERKYAVQFIMQMATQRYVPRNIWAATDGSEETRKNLQSQVETLGIGQDVVAGAKVEVQELGTNTRAFNPEEFTETVQSPIMKGLNDFSGKQGSENSHSFANAETAEEQTESGLTAFTIHLKTQVSKKLFKPWYQNNPLWTPNYMTGLMPVPWDDLEFRLNFGAVEKKNITTDQLTKLLELYLNTPIPKNPATIHKLFEQAGLDVNENDMIQMDAMYNDTSGQMAMNNMAKEQLPQNDMGGGPVEAQFNNQNIGDPPMGNPMHDSMAQNFGNPFVPTNYRRSTQNQDFNTGRDYEK